MVEAITPWIHILAVAAWLGPQLFLFVAAGPAFRLIDDAELRVRVIRFIVTRFGWLAWGAMAVIVLSGISNLFQETDDFPYVFDTDFRYYHIFQTKMVLVGLAVLLTATHTFIIGPRQLRLAEESESDTSRARRLRRLSISISALALLLSVAVVYVGALLANHEFSFQPI